MSIFVSAGGDTANAVYRRFFSPAGGNIGITAHIGGMLAGKLTHKAPSIICSRRQFQILSLFQKKKKITNKA